MSVDLLDKAVASALCPTFKALVEGSSTVAVYSGAASLIPGTQPVSVPVLKTAVSVLALSQLGVSATCPEVEVGPDPLPGTDDPRKGCIELSAGLGDIKVKSPGGVDALLVPNVTGYRVEFLREDPDIPATLYTAYVQRAIGGPYVQEDVPFGRPPGHYFEMDLQSDAVCGSVAPEIPDNPTVPDHIYVDESTNCSYTVKFLGLISEQQGGSIQPVYQIQSQSDTRSGGRMGGCNFEPTIYVGGPNGPGGPTGPPIPPIPVPPIVPDPEDGIPWWAKAMLQAATGAALTLIGQELAKLTGPVYEAGTFTLTAPCDYTEEGDNVSYFFPFPKGNFQQRVIDHQMAILDTLQYHLNSKTPICGNEKPVLEGQWVTTRWESVEKMAHSGRRLRKLFRYRTQSTRDLGQLSAYWEAFTWQAGDVCVIHKGAWWGTPQVWTSTEEEGKRVIRFAAAEAGLDPDQTGEWEFGSSRSARYGMSGTMRLEAPNGIRWVTRREGPSGVPN